jgi:hypothetical protein
MSHPKVWLRLGAGGQVGVLRDDGQVRLVFDRGAGKHAWTEMEATLEEARHFHRMLGVVLGEEE